MSAYRIDFNETECMYFMIKEKVSDKYMEIWKKVNSRIKKTINSELIIVKNIKQLKKYSAQKKANVFIKK